MGTTFKCWLIANFEIVMFWLFSVISCILLLIIGGPEKLVIGLCYAVITFVVTCPTKKGVFQFGRYILMIIAGIFLTWQPGQEVSQDLKLAARFFWIIFAVASVIAIFIASYTYRNVDEVLSRRMLYRNSNVSLFEFSWLYTLDRFCNITVAIVYHGLCVSLTVYYILTRA